LHSTPLADSEERKRVRDEMIKQIKVGLKVKLSKEHVQKTFSEHNLDKMVKKVGFMKIVAMNTSNEGIISALEGMKLRPDYREVLAKAKIPVLIILGKHDKFISLDVLEQIQLPKESEVLILENSGHQGYIEEKDKVLEKIREFGKKCRY
jgi:pimeloyl-ACP methyl ester carboxylesterase